MKLDIVHKVHTLGSRAWPVTAVSEMPMDVPMLFRVRSAVDMAGAVGMAGRLGRSVRR